MVVPVPDSGVPAALGYALHKVEFLLNMELLEITMLEEHLLNQLKRWEI